MALPFLYRHQNRHAPKRSNGRKFWGYPSRPPNIVPRVIAEHTTESLFDLMGEDTGAESVALFQSRTERPSSYHRIHDRDSTVVCLPDEAVAFGVGNFNSPTLHQSLAMRAADWSDPDKARAAEPMLHLAAQTAAEWVRKFNIPVRWITRSQALSGWSGFVEHGVMDPDRRSDPGKDFPRERFLALVRYYLNGGTAPTSQEDEMSYIGPGSNENMIRLVQQCLVNEARINGRPSPLPRFGVDGDYGDETKGAVANLQQGRFVEVSRPGICDGAFLAWLFRYEGR